MSKWGISKTFGKYTCKPLVKTKTLYSGIEDDDIIEDVMVLSGPGSIMPFMFRKMIGKTYNEWINL